MRKILINILLVLFVVAWTLLGLLPLASQYYIRKAGLSLDQNEIISNFEIAKQLNPLDTMPLTELADYYLKQSELNNGRSMDFLNQAKNLYNSALKLNSCCAEYYSTLGKIYLTLFQKDPAKHLDNFTLGIQNLKEAVNKDPFGTNISYIFGYSLVFFWNLIDREDQELALEKLKYALTYRHRYSQDAYDLAWNTFKDFQVLQKITPHTLAHQLLLYQYIKESNLWQFRKVQAEIIKDYQIRADPILFRQEALSEKRKIKDLKEKVLPMHIKMDGPTQNSWWGLNEDGSREYQNGNLYSSATIHTLINMPPGISSISISAKGSPAGRIWPYMIVELDGIIIGETFVASSDWKEYVFQVSAEGGIQVLSIIYPNDIYKKDLGWDGNLFIGDVTVKSHE